MTETELIDQWLDKLEPLVAGEGDANFPSGCIRSYRRYPVIRLQRPDPNVFFSALVVNKLLEWQHRMSDDQKQRSSQLIGRIRTSFSRYRSRRGRLHYNFWPTTPDIPFPNGRLLHRFDFFRLPDDIDDTALVYAAMQEDKAAVEALRQDIEQHFTTFYPGQPKLYAAWLGDRMPYVVDACAMTNLLNLFNRNDLPASACGLGSAEYLEKIIESRQYITSPYRAAPYYPDSSVIAYHLARWLYFCAKTESAIGFHFKKDLEELCKAESHPFKILLYSTALAYLGTDCSRHLSFSMLQPYLQTCPWFYGSMLSAVRSKALQKIGHWRAFHVAHVCEAWNFSLWVEYELLKSVTNNSTPFQ